VRVERPVPRWVGAGFGDEACSKGCCVTAGAWDSPAASAGKGPSTPFACAQRAVRGGRERMKALEQAGAGGASSPSD